MGTRSWMKVFASPASVIAPCAATSGTDTRRCTFGGLRFDPPRLDRYCEPRPDAGEPSRPLALVTTPTVERRPTCTIDPRSVSKVRDAIRLSWWRRRTSRRRLSSRRCPRQQPKRRPRTLSPASEKTAIVISGLAAASKLASARAASSSVNVLKVMASISSMNSSPLVGIWMPPKSVRCVQLQ